MKAKKAVVEASETGLGSNWPELRGEAGNGSLRLIKMSV